MEVGTFNEYGTELDKILRLRTYPIALKWYEDISEIPEGAIFPKRDLGKHMSFCQTKGLTRTRGWTIAMTLEDHWCWNPLVGFGSVDCSPGTQSFEMIARLIGINDLEKAREFFAGFPRLPLSKYKAVVTAPLEKAAFVPDVVLIYGNTNQINWLLRIVKAIRGETLKVEFDGIDSCIYSTVSPFLRNDFQVTFPDPGDRERAMSRDDEVIFTIPASLMAEFMDCASRYFSRGMGCNNMRIEFALDHGRPPFYNELFKMWGLEQGEDWR